MSLLFLFAILMGARDVAARPAGGFTHHMAEGRRSYEQGDYREAIRRFELAYQAESNPRLLCNIGRAYLKLGEARAAVLHFERCRTHPRLLASDLADVEDGVRQAMDLLDEQATVAPPLAGLDPPPSSTAPGTEAAPPLLRVPVVSAKGVSASTRSAPAPRRFSSARLAAAGTLGAALALTLATSITLSILNDRPAGQCLLPGKTQPEDCAYDFRDGAIAGYVASGLLATGVVLSLTLPEGRRKK